MKRRNEGNDRRLEERREGLNDGRSKDTVEEGSGRRQRRRREEEKEIKLKTG